VQRVVFAEVGQQLEQAQALLVDLQQV